MSGFYLDFHLPPGDRRETMGGSWRETGFGSSTHLSLSCVLTYPVVVQCAGCYDIVVNDRDSVLVIDYLI